MNLSDYFKKPNNKLEEGGMNFLQNFKFIEGKKCPKCENLVSHRKLEKYVYTCKCGYHFRVNARKRISMTADKGTFTEMFGHIVSNDPIQFPDYNEKLEAVREKSGENEAVICGTAKIKGTETCIFAMDSSFLMGSMGAAVGERITSLFEYADENNLPVVGFTVSGGARMQEGLFSLMQMAKVSGAVKRFSDNGGFYLTVLTDPTTGGVTASFAMEGDIILAEPDATVGFAGARVIRQVTGKPLPEGFQTSESVLDHGFIDAIIHREEMKQTIGKLLKMNRKREVL